MVAGTCLSALSGCGMGKPTVNLNDYVTVTENGCQEYGTVTASVDYEKLFQDYAQHFNGKLDSQIFGDKTGEAAAALAVELYDPFELAYTSPETLKNGDTVEFTWNTSQSGMDALCKVLDLNYKYDDFTYTVSNLPEVQQVDPFSDLLLEASGMDGYGWVGTSQNIKIGLPNGETYSLEAEMDAPENGKYSNGDVIHVSLENVDLEQLARSWGITLSRTEADVNIETLGYYPNENPEDLLTHISEDTIQTMSTLAKNSCSDIPGTVEVEYVGAALYYMENMSVESNSNNANNRFVFFFHMDDGRVPDGWYTYVTLNKDVCMGYELMEDGNWVKATVPKGGNKFTGTAGGGYSLPSAFLGEGIEYDGRSYSGYATLADCVNGFQAEHGGRRMTVGGTVVESYDHVIATDAVKEYVSIP